jgi:hypothetical protein
VEKKTDEREEKLGNALLKVALGYQIAEVTEEYAEVNGELKLTKRKKTKKDVPPDLKAVQLLLASEGGAEYGTWTEEELQAEKERLLASLKAASKVEEKKVKAGGRVATKVKKSGSTSKKTTVKKKSVKSKEAK